VRFTHDVPPHTPTKVIKSHHQALRTSFINELRTSFAIIRQRRGYRTPNSLRGACSTGIPAIHIGKKSSKADILARNFPHMKTPFSGGCACGAIRYECSAEPVMMFQCHCRDCQRASGASGSAMVYVPLKAFKFTRGAIKYHSTPSLMGGHTRRGFCAECGSRLTGGENDQIVGLTAASLDDPSVFRPTYHIFTSDAQPWDCMDASLPKFEKYSEEK
jgi:hypothetical protein